MPALRTLFDTWPGVMPITADERVRNDDRSEKENTVCR